MHSALYLGWVSHRRLRPRAHAFRYPLFMVYLDLAELPRVFARRWFWSTGRRNLASFRREDHLGAGAMPLDAEVRALVAAHTGCRPEGPIRLLTHLRYFGYCFNPVSFYYCFDASGTRVETIVAEVNNTPWGERHCYVLPVAAADRGTARHWHWRFNKQFHVSPFLPMDMAYDWHFAAPDRRLDVHMGASCNGDQQFAATLRLRRRPLRGADMALALLRYPWMTLQVIVAIHWQALRLWLKRVPVHAHPQQLTSLEGSASSPAVAD
jgi:uncharacterized protein